MSQAIPNTPNEMENKVKARNDIPRHDTPAFPGGGFYAGMQLRDFFAAFAMQALQMSDGRMDAGKVFEEFIAMQSYRIADAMVQARKQ